MNSNNGGTNQVGESKQAGNIIDLYEVAYEFYKEQTSAEGWTVLSFEDFIKIHAQWVFKAMQSYAASRSVGYSLEQVKEIATYFGWFHRINGEAFGTWSETEHGKSLLSVPVGVQDGEK